MMPAVLLRQIGILALVLAAATALAALLGAANFGTALTFGQVAFLIGVVWFLARG